MASFSGKPADLYDAIAYELSAIEYLRSTLHYQNERSLDSIAVTLGDLTSNGELKINFRAVAYASMSNNAVRSALDRLRPLAFSASFKLQDMIVEWILRANNVTDWPFSKKLKSYDQLRTLASLREPMFFAAHASLSRAFWELYRFLVPFRGTVVHSGGVLLQSDGTVSITKDSHTLDFTSMQQASYMRAMCLIAKILSAKLPSNSYLESLIESDLFMLQNYHNQAGLIVNKAHIARLEVEVPISQVAQRTPLAFDVDFDLLRRTMEKAYKIQNTDRLYFSVTIHVQDNNRQYLWNFPIEAIPNKLVSLQEGDPQYDRFLTISE